MSEAPMSEMYVDAGMLRAHISQLLDCRLVAGPLKPLAGPDAVNEDTLLPDPGSEEEVVKGAEMSQNILAVLPETALPQETPVPFSSNLMTHPYSQEAAPEKAAETVTPAVAMKPRVLQQPAQQTPQSTGKQQNVWQRDPSKFNPSAAFLVMKPKKA